MAGRDRMTIEEVVRKVLLDEHADVIREADKRDGRGVGIEPPDGGETFAEQVCNLFADRVEDFRRRGTLGHQRRDAAQRGSFC